MVCEYDINLNDQTITYVHDMLKLMDSSIYKKVVLGKEAKIFSNTIKQNYFLWGFDEDDEIELDED